MATIRYKQRGNKWYVYNVEQYWDKELKKPRQRTKYLGVSETKGGEYRKTGRVAKAKIEKEILDYGDSFVINEVTKSMELDTIIKSNFGDLDSIMALLAFQITEGSAMYNCEDWIEGNVAKRIFPNAKVKSQEISRLIKHLGQQDLQTKFFKDYINKFFKTNKQSVLIDSTALPSAINAGINAIGYSGGTIERNVTCLMLVDKLSKLPIYFRPVGGDIADISTLKTTIAEVKKLGISPGSAILDAGFCSKENLEFMCSDEIDFITRLPRSHKIFFDIVKQIDDIESTDNVAQYGDRFVFIKSSKMKIYGHEMYAHVVLDPGKKTKDTNKILKDKTLNSLEDKEKIEINEKLKAAGYFILLSKNEIAKKDILPNYYERQTIEQIFGFAKHNSSILPLRVHGEEAIRGYLMLVFLALIIFITMRQKIKIPMDKALLNLRTLKVKIFDDDLIVQEPNKKVKDLLKKLNVVMPT